MRTDDRTDDAARARSNPPDAPAGPIRTCVGCRHRAPRTALVRVVLDPDRPSRAVVDERRSAPGRGAWLHGTDACLALAERRRALRRALRASGEVATDGIRAWMEQKEHRGVAPQDATADPTDQGKRVGS